MLSSRTLALTAAAIASLGATTASHAATFGGFTMAAGVLRTVAAVNQASTGATNATSYLSVTTCAGVVQYPVFVVTGATTCQAVGAGYQINMTVSTANQTRVRITATAATCQVRSVKFGTPNSMCGYDLTNPNPGTLGSLTGFNPVPTILVGGAWNATIRFDNAVRIGGMAPVGDLYNIMTVNFSSCFDVGDVFEFVVDTDRLQ